MLLVPKTADDVWSIPLSSDRTAARVWARFLAAYGPPTEAIRWSAMVDRRLPRFLLLLLPSSSVQQKIEGLAADTLFVSIPT